ncbi:O-antigen ligase family protein [Candidatus Parcubacteria bacterium]|nr:O-antigen ligase family protein [Candidatus Parcubacteria bacterium]
MHNYKKILPYIILAELISLTGFLVPEINTLAFFAIIALTLVAAMISLELGLLILFTELFIGSKGQLFFFESEGVLISIRIALWLVIMSVWAAKFLNLYLKKEIDKREIKKQLARHKLFYYFIILLFFIGFGLINGFLNNNSFNNIFFDFNGWLYFLLVFPIFTLPLVEPEFNYKKFRNNLSAVFMAGIIWLSIKTLILLYFFSHNIIGVVEPIYRWVRESGVGEITRMDSGFTRVFFQSHIFALIGFIIILAHSLKLKINLKDKKFYLFIGLLSLLLTATIISFSRSNWLGLATGLLFYYFTILLFAKHRWQKIWQSTTIIILSGVFSLIFIAGIIKFPFPAPGIGFSASFIQERATQISSEAGVSSRWALLPELLNEIKKKPIFGAGFGATVSYKTSDPRVLEQNPDGQYTTYAFEWGFLDIWLKLGILGLSAYLALIVMIFVLAYKQIKKQDITALGLLLGLIVISTVSFFSPYLNHPLGIGYVILVAFFVKDTRNKDTNVC